MMERTQSPMMHRASIGRILYFVCCFVLTCKTVCARVPQRFINEPEDHVVVRGATVILRCYVDNLFGEVQWTRDGFGLGTDLRLPGFPRYSISAPSAVGDTNLMIRNAQLEDDAVFQCQVMATNQSPSLLSRKATLTVNVPVSTVSIEGGPVVEVVADTATNLTCLAGGGRPAANISVWLDGGAVEGGAEEGDDGAVEGREVVITARLQQDGKRLDVTGTLVFVPSLADEGREVSCRVQNAAMKRPMWKYARLAVLYLPIVTMRTVSGGVIREYDNLRFVCEAHGNPTAITWRWYIGETQVQDANSNVFELRSIARDLHGKMLSCEASNTVGPARQSYLLKIKYGPRFAAALDYVAADIGDAAELTCHVDSNPPASVVWTRQDGAAASSRRILSSADVYRISPVTSTHFATYECVAATIGFDDVRRLVHLLRKGPPRVTSEAVQYVRLGEVGRLECATESIPKPTSITWRRDGRVLEWDDLPRYQVVATNSPRGQMSTIHISGVEKGDLGVYNCSVQNGYGADSALIELHKQASVPMAYLLTGVLIGILVIIAVIVAIFLYQRRKSRASESSSDSTVSSIAKKVGSGDVALDYRGGAGPVEAWRNDCDTKYYRYSAEYDELNYPAAKEARGQAGYDYKDGYGNYGYDYRRDYGTYPGTAKPYDSRYHPGQTGSFTDGDVYGTYPRPHPEYTAASDYGTRPAANGDSSRLSTNV